MNDGTSHYEVLGLHASARSETIRTAVDRLGEQANRLAYTSPTRSRELWEQIRGIKADLLAGAERREAYDRTIQWREPPPPEIPAAAPITPAPVRRRSWRPGLLVAAVPAVALLAALAILLIARAPTGNRTPHPLAMLLSARGDRQGNAFASGKRLTLHWTAVPGAAVYEVQVATAPHPTGGSIFSRHVLKDDLTQRTAYPLTPVGAQLYYWRVRAFVAGRWKAYSGAEHFAVARPTISIPTLVSPPDGATRTAGRITLCWSSVSGAAGYRLQIEGLMAQESRSICFRSTLRPGSYRWSAAALVRGAHLYTGRHSVWASLTVASKPILVAERVSPRRAPAHARSRPKPEHKARQRPAAIRTRQQPSRLIAAVAPPPAAPPRVTGVASRTPVVQRRAQSGVRAAGRARSPRVVQRPVRHRSTRRSSARPPLAFRSPSHRVTPRIPVRVARASPSPVELPILPAPSPTAPPAAPVVAVPPPVSGVAPPGAAASSPSSPPIVIVRPGAARGNTPPPTAAPVQALPGQPVLAPTAAIPAPPIRGPRPRHVRPWPCTVPRSCTEHP